MEPTKPVKIRDLTPAPSCYTFPKFPIVVILQADAQIRGSYVVQSPLCLGPASHRMSYGRNPGKPL